MQEWREYLSILNEVEPYQKWAKAQNLRFKKDTLTKGKQKNTSPYTKKPVLKSKSGLGPLEEADYIPEIQEDLNQDIWTSDKKLDPEISEKLLKIARDFYESLGLPAEIKDITFTGSLANYNWTDKSDVDLHIVIDYNDVNEDKELVKKFLSEAKTNWNRNHEIKIKDHEVEVYVQDENEPHHSTGVYSVLNDEWIIEPEPQSFQVSENDVRKKTQSMMDSIDMIDRLQREGRSEEAYGEADRMKQKLSDFRRAGLSSAGEFSVENIVFKNLRNFGYLEKLSNVKRDAYDSIMTLKEEG